MNVIVEDSCIACGACESICDAVFSIEDKAVVNADAVEANADAVQEAAAACPVSAIIVEQLTDLIKKRGKIFVSLTSFFY